MSFFVEKAEIDAPCVDAHGGDVTVCPARAFVQRGLDFVKNTQNIPCKLSRNHDRFIREPMIFLKCKALSVKGTDNAASARGAEVYGKHFEFFHNYVNPFEKVFLIWQSPATKRHPHGHK